MKAGFDAGTDIAMIGAWDAQRGTQPFSADEFKKVSETLEAEATAGHIFVVHTGGDGGGGVDVYIDEPIPDETMARLTPLGEEELVLALPSGTLIVDGVEYYRAKKPDTARADRGITVPAGEYLLRAYSAKEEEAKPRSERDLEALVGTEDLRYYERMTRAGCLNGLLLLLLFPLLFPFFGSKVAVAVTVVAFVAYFAIREQVLRRNERFARLRETIAAFRLQRQEPAFVLELHRIENRLASSLQ